MKGQRTLSSCCYYTPPKPMRYKEEEIKLINKIYRGKRMVHLKHIALTAYDIEGISIAIKYTSTLQILNLSWCKIGDSKAMKLELAIADNKSIHTLFLIGNNISNIGAVFLIRAARSNTALKAIHLFNNFLITDTKFLDDEVFNNQNLLYIYYYNGQSDQLLLELKKRQAYIKGLIKKWNTTKDHSNFTVKDIVEFYNNIAAINCVKENELSKKYKLDVAAFEKEISSKIVYCMFNIKEAIIPHLANMEHVMHLSSICLNIEPIDTKPKLYNLQKEIDEYIRHAKPSINLYIH